MSRRDRRHAKQEVKKFVPNKKNALPMWIITALGVVVVFFFVGTMLIQRG